MNFRLNFVLIIIFIIKSEKIAAADDLPNHTNNWAVIVDTSRFWFNYRHAANVLSIYRSVKRLGIPDRYNLTFVFDSLYLFFLI